VSKVKPKFFEVLEEYRQGKVTLDQFWKRDPDDASARGTARHLASTTHHDRSKRTLRDSDEKQLVRN
jgi:hypothetical protein